MGKIKEIFTNWRVILMILFLIATFVAINPKFGDTGVMVASIDTNSSAAKNGVTNNLIISELNGQNLANTDDYYQIIQNIQPDDIVKITSDGSEYSFVAESQNNQTYLGLQVKEVPASNIKKGLDLSGGVRVLLRPEGELSDQQLSDVIEITKRRLNVYGLSDISVRQVKDLEGNKFMLVELAGATVSDVEDLIAKQGKFEAKVGNKSVFVGGEDITSVCRSADCSGIDPHRGCGQTEDGAWMCSFRFQISLSSEAAKKHADATKNLDVITKNNERYLNETLDLYLDDELVDSLLISSGLKGAEETTIVISGPGSGLTQVEAMEDALNNMKSLQTILITGSLPVKLTIDKIDVVSPTLGSEFLRSAIIAFIGIALAVGAIIGIKYRKLKVAIPVIVIALSEIFMMIGVSAIVKNTLDLAGIAGILAAMGTGVDDQIVITDEVLSKEAQEVFRDWKTRLKSAFFIIMAAYFTTVVAMIPLLAIGAGLMRGFAIMTIIGITIGVFITRPAYAEIVKIINK